MGTEILLFAICILLILLITVMMIFHAKEKKDLLNRIMAKNAGEYKNISEGTTKKSDKDFSKTMLGKQRKKVIDTLKQEGMVK